MTDEMKDILYGALLGDGSLSKSIKSQNSRFCYSSKSRQHVEYVCHKFMEYSSGNGIYDRNRYDKRTNKCYESHDFQSICSPTFTQERTKWYMNDIKHIPDDLVLTALVCKIWYLGDGSLVKIGTHSYRLVLYTNCFQKYELENILLKQLTDFNPHLMRMDNTKNDGTGYAIYIGEREKIINFLEYIGECPFADYSYKWNILKNDEIDKVQENDSNEKTSMGN